MKNIFFLSGSIFFIVIVSVFNFLLLRKIDNLEKLNYNNNDIKSQLLTVIKNNYNLINQPVDILNIKTGSKKILFRYTDISCDDCIADGIAVLNSIYKDNLKQNLLIVTNTISNTRFRQYETIVTDSQVSEIDKTNQPYICFMDEHGLVRFYLLLKPQNIDLNADIIKYIL